MRKTILLPIILAVYLLAACSSDPSDGGTQGGVIVVDEDQFDGSNSGSKPDAKVDGATVPGKDAGGAPTCKGSASSCSLRTSSKCLPSLGCTMGGDCTGSARGCYSYYDLYSCSSQQGCFWSSYSKNCSGSSSSCYLMGSSSCTGQEGCYWSDKCEGLAFACSTMSVTTCASQPGCYAGN